MNLRHPVVALAATAGWLLLTSGYAAAAEPAVDLGGARVSGSTDAADPLRLEAGLWADRLGHASSGSSTHYFTYSRQMRFSTVHVGVVGAPQDPDGDAFSVTLLGPDEVECGSASASASSYVDNGVFGARVWAGSDTAGVTGDEPCLQAGTLDIVVERTTTGGDDEELPIAVKIVEEAPIISADSLPPAEESPSYAPGSEPTGGELFAGSTSFDDAPTVPLSGGSASFSAEIAEGEQRLYRVPLAWGQAVTVEATSPRLDEATAQARYSGPTVELSLVDPLRHVVDDAVDGLTPSDYATEEEAAELSVGLPRVAYLNRYEFLDATLPGDHWLAIGVSGTPDDVAATTAALDVRVEVDGSAGQAPTYQETVQSPDGGAGPGGYSPATPFLIGPDEFSAVASGTPALPDAEDDGWWGPRRYAGTGLAVASLLCCGLGVRRLLR